MIEFARSRSESLHDRRDSEVNSTVEKWVTSFSMLDTDNAEDMMLKDDWIVVMTFHGGTPSTYTDLSLDMNASTASPRKTSMLLWLHLADTPKHLHMSASESPYIL